MSSAQSIARLSQFTSHIVSSSAPSRIARGPRAAPGLRTMATAASSSGTASAAPTPRKLKILMLHGYTQSGPNFRAKTRALEKSLSKAFPASPNPSKPLPGSLPQYPGGVELLYPTAPHRLSPSQIPGYTAPISNEGGGAAGNGVARVAEDDEIDAWAWWRRDESSGLYYGLEEGLERIADTMRDAGGVDGVIGFSQGGAAAGMVASLLEPDRPSAFAAAAKDGGLDFPASFVREDGERVNAPLKFAVSYSGFFAPHPRYRAFYEPKIATPLLHVIGSLDTVVEENRTRGLVERCVGGEERVVVHPGGHFVPVGKEWVGALVGFIREVVGKEVKEEGKGKEEESVEDMDMPF